MSEVQAEIIPLCGIRNQHSGIMHTYIRYITLHHKFPRRSVRATGTPYWGGWSGWAAARGDGVIAGDNSGIGNAVPGKSYPGNHAVFRSLPHLPACCRFLPQNQDSLRYLNVPTAPRSLPHVAACFRVLPHFAAIYRNFEKR